MRVATRGDEVCCDRCDRVLYTLRGNVEARVTPIYAALFIPVGDARPLEDGVVPAACPSCGGGSWYAAWYAHMDWEARKASRMTMSKGDV